MLSILKLFVGETLLLMFLPEGNPLVAGSVIRFIVFDGSGLVFFCCYLTGFP